MYELMDFFIKNVYCSPTEDKQYTFKLVRISKVGVAAKYHFSLYGVLKTLPDAQYNYQVYLAGNSHPSKLNLLSQDRDWFRDTWINVEEDMNKRKYILQLYDTLGINAPRSNIWYTYTDENVLLLALRLDDTLTKNYPTYEDFKFLRVYSSKYIRSEDYSRTTKSTIGIRIFSKVVANNTDKANIQNEVAKLGGVCIYYVNGYYTDKLSLNIHDYSHVEVLFDESISHMETYKIDDLRAYSSYIKSKDSAVAIGNITDRYLVYRPKTKDYIEYYDDNEIYIVNSGRLVNKGVYYYLHGEEAAMNATDKDYTLSASYVNKQANHLSSLTTGAVNDKYLNIYVRKVSSPRKLVYSSLKLHELYKLPNEIQKEVISNTGYTTKLLRLEYIDKTYYMRAIRKESIEDLELYFIYLALGYNGICYYFANTPQAATSAMDVPTLYQVPSYAYEYNVDGKLININTTTGPIYIPTSNKVKYVEYIQGRTPEVYTRYYNNTDVIDLKDIAEFSIASAYFVGSDRISEWKDLSYWSNRLLTKSDTTSPLERKLPTIIDKNLFNDNFESIPSQSFTEYTGYKGKLYYNYSIDGDPIHQDRVIANIIKKDKDINEDIHYSERFDWTKATKIQLSEDTNRKVKVSYNDEPNTYTEHISIEDGTIYFPLRITEDRGFGVAVHKLDMPYLSIEIFLNGYRLAYKTDWFLSNYFVGIVNKTYINYSLAKQEIHVRMRGPTLEEKDINSNEIRGYISHGAVSRNNYYDIRDDKVYTLFIDGKLYPRDKIYYAEEDNTIRIDAPLNGKPYTICEHYVSVNTLVTNIVRYNNITTLLRKINNQSNKDIEDLYNYVYPETKVLEVSAIKDHHYVYSPVISRIITDILDGNISSHTYTTPYNDNDIVKLLDEKYKKLVAIDPIKNNLPTSIVEIHPHIGNTTIELTVPQYRFVDNVIRVFTLNNKQRINISGYLRVKS